MCSAGLNLSFALKGKDAKKEKEKRNSALNWIYDWGSKISVDILDRGSNVHLS